MVGLGGIGLDFRLDISREIQRSVFSQQLNLAVELKKPVAVYARRDTQDETVEILFDKVVDRSHPIHLVGELPSLDVVKRLLDHFGNLFVGVNGIVTFTDAKDVRELVKEVRLKSE